MSKPKRTMSSWEVLYRALPALLDPIVLNLLVRWQKIAGTQGVSTTHAYALIEPWGGRELAQAARFAVRLLQEFPLLWQKITVARSWCTFLVATPTPQDKQMFATICEGLGMAGGSNGNLDLQQEGAVDALVLEPLIIAERDSGPHRVTLATSMQSKVDVSLYIAFKETSFYNGLEAKFAPQKSICGQVKADILEFRGVMTTATRSCALYDPREEMCTVFDEQGVRYMLWTCRLSPQTKLDSPTCRRILVAINEALSQWEKRVLPSPAAAPPS